MIQKQLPPGVATSGAGSGLMGKRCPAWGQLLGVSGALLAAALQVECYRPAHRCKICHRGCPRQLAVFMSVQAPE